MLLTDEGWVAVLDGCRFLGILTPEAVYRALRSLTLRRRPVPADDPPGDGKTWTSEPVA